MKIFVLCLAFACVAYASAAAIPDYDGPNDDLALVEEPRMDMVEPPRVRRFSCDLFSFTSHWFTPNHAVCAGKCMFQGRRGGTCNNGECICRN